MKFQSIIPVKWENFKETRYKILATLTPSQCLFGKKMYIKTEFENIFLEDEQEIHYYSSIAEGVLYETVSTDEFEYKTETAITETELKKYKQAIYPLFGLYDILTLPKTKSEHFTFGELHAFLEKEMKKEGNEFVYRNTNFEKYHFQLTKHRKGITIVYQNGYLLFFGICCLAKMILEESEEINSIIDATKDIFKKQKVRLLFQSV